MRTAHTQCLPNTLFLYFLRVFPPFYLQFNHLPIPIPKPGFPCNMTFVLIFYLLYIFDRVYCFHRHLEKQCREFSVHLTQPELDKAKICYIQDLLVWLENKQIQTQNMEWGADLQSNGSHQSIIDFKSNIDHAQADEVYLFSVLISLWW